MAFGDGDGSTFSNLATGLDVTSHELTHAVCSRTADLVYEKESGALNEANSDILGRAAAFWSGNGSPATTTAWAIGADVYTPGTSGDALRYMYDPAKDGAVGRLLPDPQLLRHLHAVEQQRRVRRPHQQRHREPLLLPPLAGRHPPAREDDRRRHRRRPDEGRADLVPRAVGLHDLVHDVPGGAHGDGERRVGPLRRHLHGRVDRPSTRRGTPSASRGPGPAGRPTRSPATPGRAAPRSRPAPSRRPPTRAATTRSPGSPPGPTRSSPRRSAARSRRRPSP